MTVTCPKCGSTKIGKYQYGLPVMTAKTKRDVDAGKIILGGCTIKRDVSPKYHCHACENDFGIFMTSEEDTP